MTDPCQIAGYRDDLTCPARESGGIQCERTDTHDETGHWISPHTIEHSLAGNGYACEAFEQRKPENMSENPYPEEELNISYSTQDDGTMPENVETLRQAVVGHRIVSAEQGRYSLELTLDNGRRVTLRDYGDCCAYTELESFLLHPERVQHVITGVGTTDGYETWHIYADLGDVMELKVGWSAGNVGYYAYGFKIQVEDPAAEAAR